MNTPTLRMLVADARRANVGSVQMAVRSIEDIADNMESLEKQLSESRERLRAEFAMAALQGMLASPAIITYYKDSEELSKGAYFVASAMMKASGR